MKRFLIMFLGGILVFSMCACGGKSKEENPEADSLRNVISGNMAEMDEMTLFLDAVNTSMDSIVAMDGNILRTSGESPKSVKDQIRDNLDTYKQILKLQHDRIAILEEKLMNGDAKSQQMLHTISLLKRQLSEKDQAIIELTKELEQKNFDIKMLKEHVERLNTHVAKLTETNKAQEEVMATQSDMLNEAYYIIGTKSELQKAGVMTKGTLLKKGKLSMNGMDASAFHKIDIRKTKTFTIPGTKPQILTQAPSNSYTITKNDDGTSTLTVTDAASFWSISNYLVIKY